MQKNSLWRAKLMARMARDGDVDGLAEIISEMMEEPAPDAVIPAAAAPAAIPVAIAPEAASAADPMVAAVVTAVEENLAPAEEAPVVVETPVEQPVIVDCGPQILEALQRIIALLSGAEDCDPAPQEDCNTSPARDDDPVLEAVAETAAEELAETVASAAMEAIAGTVDPDLTSDEDPADPLDAVVETILEVMEQPASDPTSADAEEPIQSSVLEPVSDEEENAPARSTNGSDALRAALIEFRPILRRMNPKQRQRFNADVAARMKLLSDAEAKGKPGAYAAIRNGAARDNSGKSLGQKIMAARNANLRK